MRLHEEGLIYRGKRLVNWDPVLGTAVSDLEVDSEEENGKLWEIRYPFEDGLGSVVVATTRPETMLGDVAVAVNPKDERYAELVGKRVMLPLTGRSIPVIADDYVDREFGTGCVKITPAHDFNDWQIGQRHQLAPINILTLAAQINDNAPAAYRDLDRFEARKQVLADLQSQGLLVSEKPYLLRVPRSGRTGAIVEPMLTDQWFVKMDGLAKRGLEAVAEWRSEILSRALGDHLQPVARKYPGLVHLAPVVVGPPDSGVVRRQRQHHRRAQRGRGAQPRDRDGLYRQFETRPGRARHLVFVRAGAVHFARLAGRDRATSRCICRRRCW